MTSTQHKLLQFTLGLNTRKSAHRNCLSTGPDEDTFADVSALESTGFMYQGARIPGGLTYFHASEAGVAAARCTFEDFQHLFTAIVRHSNAEHARAQGDANRTQAPAKPESPAAAWASAYAAAERAAPVKVERTIKPATAAVSPEIAGYEEEEHY